MKPEKLVFTQKKFPISNPSTGSFDINSLNACKPFSRTVITLDGLRALRLMTISKCSQKMNNDNCIIYVNNSHDYYTIDLSFIDNPNATADDHNNFQVIIMDFPENENAYLKDWFENGEKVTENTHKHHELQVNIIANGSRSWTTLGHGGSHDPDPFLPLP